VKTKSRKEGWQKCLCVSSNPCRQRIDLDAQLACLVVGGAGDGWRRWPTQQPWLRAALPGTGAAALALAPTDTATWQLGLCGLGVLVCCVVVRVRVEHVLVVGVAVAVRSHPMLV
jgi:hypothetical protein